MDPCGYIEFTTSAKAAKLIFTLALLQFTRRWNGRPVKNTRSSRFLVRRCQLFCLPDSKPSLLTREKGACLWPYVLRIWRNDRAPVPQAVTDSHGQGEGGRVRRPVVAASHLTTYVSRAFPVRDAGQRRRRAGLVLGDRHGCRCQEARGQHANLKAMSVAFSSYVGPVLMLVYLNLSK